MKFIRVDMTRRSVTEETISKDYEGLGGRGLTAVMINREVPAECNPLGPENKIIFAPGLLSGTSLVNTSRLSVGAKSPLTHTIKESNVGGTVAVDLGRLGIGAVIVEGQGQPGETYILCIDNEGRASLVTAGDHRDIGTYALVDKLRKRYGDKQSILCIGPAGEQQLATASIQAVDTDGRSCRAAGRGGGWARLWVQKD